MNSILISLWSYLEYKFGGSNYFGTSVVGIFKNVYCMISIRNKYSLLFIFSIFLFQSAIILYPGWRVDDAAFFY